jgi:hypothetical protein
VDRPLVAKPKTGAFPNHISDLISPVTHPSSPAIPLAEGGRNPSRNAIRHFCSRNRLLIMDRAVRTLESAIDSAVSLSETLKPPMPQKDLDEFTTICQRFIDLRTKYMLMKTLEEGGFPSDFSPEKLNALRSQNSDLTAQIHALQQSIQDVPTDELHSLIDRSRQTLSEVQAKLDEAQGANVEELLRLAQEELAELEAVSANYGWYEEAYKKLSGYTGIEIGSDHTIRVLETHWVRITGDSLEIDPPEVFVGDLDLSTSSPGVCVSEIIERLSALKDMRAVGRELGWRLEIEDNAPVVSLFPPAGGPPAMFALIGYQEHPLIEWGEVNVDEFNGIAEPTTAKLGRFLRTMRKF